MAVYHILHTHCVPNVALAFQQHVVTRHANCARDVALKKYLVYYRHLLAPLLLSMDPVTIEPRHQQRDQHSDAVSPTVEAQTETPPKQDSFFTEIVKFSILALLIVVPFRMFVAQPFIVSGASMAPTFETGEYLIVDRATYHLEQPERGDVVVFRYPNDPSKFFIKRIIGLPGETVELANGITTIEANTERSVLDEPYLERDRTDDHLTITLSKDEYFVMGDNRGASSDSRVWGPVPRENIVGRAFIRLLPPTHFGVLPGAHVYETPGVLTTE